MHEGTGLEIEDGKAKCKALLVLSDTHSSEQSRTINSMEENEFP